MGQQRVIQGTVVSDKMDKTIVVSIERRKKHRLYHKVVSLTQRYKAHDEENSCRLGDVVRIAECRPMSRDKCWRVIEILSRGDVRIWSRRGGDGPLSRGGRGLGRDPPEHLAGLSGTDRL